MSGAACFECGAPAEHDHHVVPRSRGGTRTIPLCTSCHAKAHHRSGNMAHNRLTSEALRRKRRKGGRVGSIPAGFRLAPDGVALEPCPKERRIVDAVQQAGARGLSRRAIAREVNAAGYVNRAGRPFTHVTIGNILKANPAPVLVERAAKSASPAPSSPQAID